MLMFHILKRGGHPYDAPTIDEMESKIRLDQPDLSAVSDLVTVDILKQMLPAKPENRSSAASLLG